jgi:hypothetical protein
METLSLETLRRMAAQSGFTWTDTELEALRPVLLRTSALLAALEALPLGAVEPATQFRIL